MSPRLPCVLWLLNCTWISFRKEALFQSIIFYKINLFLLYFLSEPHSSIIHPLRGTHSLSTLHCLCWNASLWPQEELVESSDHITRVFVLPQAAQCSAASRNSIDDYSIYSLSSWWTLKEILKGQKQRCSSVLEKQCPGTDHREEDVALGLQMVGSWNQDPWIKPEASKGCSLHVNKSRRTPWIGWGKH